MKMGISRLRRITIGFIASVALSGIVWADAAEPYPLEFWALREAVNNVSLSPNGERIGLMRIMSKEGDPVLEILDASDLSKKPFRMDSDPMEITTFDWVGDDVIAGGATKIFTNAPAGRVLLGYPAMKMDAHVEAYKGLRRLPRLFRDVAALKKAVSNRDQSD